MAVGMSVKVQRVAADQSTPLPIPFENGSDARTGKKQMPLCALLNTPRLHVRDAARGPTPISRRIEGGIVSTTPSESGDTQIKGTARSSASVTRRVSVSTTPSESADAQIKGMAGSSASVNFDKTRRVSAPTTQSESADAQIKGMVGSSASVNFDRARRVSLDLEKPAKLQRVTVLAQDVSNAAISAKSLVKEVSIAHNGGHITNIRPQANLRVLCYGDSNTAGFCSKGAKFEPYAASLEKTLRAAGVACEVYHAGLSGLTAAELADKMDDSSIVDICKHECQGLRKMIGTYQPHVVIIMVGTNDIANNADLAHMMEPIARLHETCHDKGIPTIALAPPAGTGCHRRDQLASTIKYYASIVPGVAWYGDAEELLPRGPLGYWEPDIIHLSPEGSRALGQLLGPVIIQFTKVASQPMVKFAHACAGA